jgi:hypothetical protein
MAPYVKENPKEFSRMVGSPKGKIKVVGVKFFDTSYEAVAFAALFRKKHNVFAVARTLTESYTSGGFVGGVKERHLVLMDEKHLDRLAPEIEKLSRMLDERRSRSSYYVK